MFTSNFLMKCILVCISVQMISVAMAANKKTVVYWGQNSIGSFTNDKNQWEKPLREYCADPNIDIFVVGFVYLFPNAPGGSTYPGMNFANHCEVPFDDANPYLLDCTDNVAPDIKYCQSLGKTVLLSFGGGVGQYGFSSDSQATTFAHLIWNMFLGGTDSSIKRPFGTAIFDGIDLDIEGGSAVGYTSFINTLRAHYATASKKYYISAAPQCFYPDRIGPGAGTPMNDAWFDYIWIQFYNNHCGVDEYPTNFNFAKWAAWAATGSVNPKVELFIGVPASAQAAASGYIGLAQVQLIANAMNVAYPNIYSGIMLWDACMSDHNGNFASKVGAFVKTQSSGVAPTPATPTPATPTPTAKLTTGAKLPSTTGAVKPATTAKVATPVIPSMPSTTGKNNAGNSKPSTTGSVKPSTTGRVVDTTPTVVITPTTPTGSCTERSMRCVTSETYSMCDRGTWSPALSCQAGLVCAPHGDVIYCERKT